MVDGINDNSKKFVIYAEFIIVEMLLCKFLVRRATPRGCSRNSSTTSAWNVCLLFIDFLKRYAQCHLSTTFLIYDLVARAPEGINWSADLNRISRRCPISGAYEETVVRKSEGNFDDHNLMPLYNYICFDTFKLIEILRVMTSS